jgi:hypothetical protein
MLSWFRFSLYYEKELWAGWRTEHFHSTSLSIEASYACVLWVLSTISREPCLQIETAATMGDHLQRD